MGATLVLGGARSGKSAYAQREAESVAHRLGVTPLMIVTATALDAEMTARIARHQDERGDRWITLEAAIALSEAIDGLQSHNVAVVDCLTLWLTNLMLAEEGLERHVARLEASVSATSAALWLVANEVGLGIVPETPLGRRFRDEAGWLHQRLARASDRVVFVAAGLPLILKPPPPSAP